MYERSFLKRKHPSGNRQYALLALTLANASELSEYIRSASVFCSLVQAPRRASSFSAASRLSAALATFDKRCPSCLSGAQSAHIRT